MLPAQFEHTCFAKLWKSLISTVYMYGDESAPRGMKTRELLGVQVRLNDLRNCLLDNPARDLNPRFAIAEWLWIQAGRNDVATISRWNRNIVQFSDDGDIFAGAYGPRLFPQWGYLVASLNKPDSRQAVATIWTPNPRLSKDIPCTLTYQLLLRNNVLHAIVTMRSSDLWLGLPYDMFNFAMITNGIAGHIGAKRGSITFQLGSAHVYERDFTGIENVMYNNLNSHSVRMPKLPDFSHAETILSSAAELLEGKSAISLIQPWHAFQYALGAPNKKMAWKVIHDLELASND